MVVWTDVDMSYPNDLIPELVRELEGYDQVVGARTSEEGTHKLFRVPAKAAIRKLASYLVQTPIPDLNSGMRAFRRDVALQYVSQLPRVQLRHHHHHDLPGPRLHREVLADHVLDPSGHLEVSLALGRDATCCRSSG